MGAAGVGGCSTSLFGSFSADLLALALLSVAPVQEAQPHQALVVDSSTET